MYKGKNWIMIMTSLIVMVALIAACGPANGSEPTQPAAPGDLATEVPGMPTEPVMESPVVETPPLESPAAETPAGMETPAGAETEVETPAGAEPTGAGTPEAAIPATGGTEAAPGGAEGPFTIGISNPFISSEYRTQMIDELQQVNAEYMDQGLTTELVIESADTDVAGQIQQLQNLMNRGVDAILVNPSDINGLNATLQEALDQGIIVISVDQELPNAEGVYNVGIDQREWARISAEWLAEQLGGQGDIVLIEGIPGHPANVARMSGVEDVLAQYPDINVLGRETANWDEATGQQVMSNFLASFPNMSGYWTQDGMAIGAFQAVLAANPAQFPVVVGEGRCQFLQLWNERLQADPEFETIAVANPPGVAATGLRIAVNMLQGKQVDESMLSGESGRQFTIPVPVIVTADNFQEVFETCADRPATYLLDGIMTDEEVQQFFAQ